MPIASHVGLVSFYLLYFVTDVHGISPFWAGIALLMPRVFNIVFDPVMGAVSDRTSTRFGRRRPFLFVGSLLWGLSIMLLFGMPVDQDALQGGAALFAAFMAVAIGQTLYHVPYSAMLAEMTQDARERISLAAWKESVSRLGILIAATATPLLVARFGSEAQGYRASGMVFGGIIIVGGLVAFVTTASAPAAPPADRRTGFGEQMRALADNGPFCRLVAAYMLVMCADEIFSSSLVFYAVNVLGRTPAFVGQAYPVSSIAAVCVIPIWNAAAGRHGKLPMLFVALAGMAASWLAVLAIPAQHAWLMLPLMAVGGAFNAGLLMLPNAMVADTVEYDAVRSGERREGAIYGAWIFCQQTAMALGGFALSMSLTWIGYRTGGVGQTPSVLTGLAVVIAVVPASLLACACLLVCHYPLTEARTAALVARERTFS